MKKRFACLSCQKSFETKQGLSLHRTRTHTFGKPEKGYKCVITPPPSFISQGTFAGKEVEASVMEEAIKDFRPKANPVEPAKCPWCEAEFGSTQAYMLHLNSCKPNTPKEHTKPPTINVAREQRPVVRIPSCLVGAISTGTLEELIHAGADILITE